MFCENRNYTLLSRLPKHKYKDERQEIIQKAKLFVQKLFSPVYRRPHIKLQNCCLGLFEPICMQMIYHRVKPVWKGNVLRYFVCSVECSVVNKAGHLRMHYKTGLIHKDYNPKTGKWERTTRKPLTEYERAILMLARQGKSIRKIANILSVESQSMRLQVTKLYAKLGVRSMQQAIIFASSHCLIFGDKQEVEPPPKRKRTLLTTEKLQRIQQALDNGQSIRYAAREEGIALSAVQYWISKGKLKK